MNGGGDLKCKDREGRCTSVCVYVYLCVSGSKFAYVHLRFFYNLGATRAAAGF